jgi:hypothetical protein
MARLFGFSIDDETELSPSTLSPVPPSDEDGADFYLTSGFFGSYIDIEAIYRTEFDLIRRYREMSLHPEVDSAIEDIVNEAIVSDTNDSPVQIELSNLDASDNLKNTIRKEFKYILELLDFDKKSHEIYRNWYVDGRLYYHKVIDIKNPQEGIQDLRYIDAMKMRFVRQEVGGKKNNDKANTKVYGDADPLNYKFPKIEEYFVYSPNTSYPVGTPKEMSGGQEKSVKFARDAIVYCTSGLVDRNKGVTLSYLNKASKTLNQLRMIEDSLVIYRLLRSSERRVFYIDVGNLPKQKAEQYLQDVMRRYRNRMAYSTSDGTIRDDKKFMSVMDDFFLPRREGGRGTQLDIVPGGSNLGELTDINYFQRKLYKDLNVPESRIGGDGGFNLGRSSEILRDEVKFSKFVGRLRKRFSTLFTDLLKTQLILKNIITVEEWQQMNEHIQFDFLYDNHFAELKEAELLMERMNNLSVAQPYIGVYFSRDYARRKILRQTDQEIVEEDLKIKDEIEKGIIPDPSIPVDPNTGQPLETNGNNIKSDMGKVPVEQTVDTSSVEAPKGGEI